MSITLSQNRIAPNPRFFGRFHRFANSKLRLQLSIWVLIVSQYDIYQKDAVLDAPPPPIPQFAIQSLFVESFRTMHNFWCTFTATQGIVIRSPIREWEVKEHRQLHLLRLYHIVIRSELNCLFGTKVLSSWQWGSALWKTRPRVCGFMSAPGNKPAKTQRVRFLDGSGSEPHLLSGSNPDHWRVTRTRC